MATAPDTTQQITRALAPKRVDQFYVFFQEMPENYGNVLGRQVKSIERPTVTFDTYSIYFKGNPNNQTSNAGFESISVVFEDDDQSLVNYALYRQIYRQNNNNPPLGENSKFSVRVEAYDAQYNKVEEYIMLGCIITGVTHSEQIYAESSRNEITVTLMIDDCDYKNIASQTAIKSLTTVD